MPSSDSGGGTFSGVGNPNVMKSGIRFCLLNLNNLANKKLPLAHLLDTYRIDVAAVTETWLFPDILDPSLRLPGFHPIARTDSRDCREGVRKHGVCFYVSTKIQFVSVECNCPNVHVVLLSNLNLYCVVVYRPPSNSDVENTTLVNFLATFSVGREVIVLGDFNLPAVNWAIRRAHTLSYDRLTDALLDCFNSLGLHQWVTFPTFLTSGNTLDLILTSEPDRVGEVFPAPPLPGCKHIPAVCDYVFSSRAVPSTTSPTSSHASKRDWIKGKYNRINDLIRDVDWDMVLDLGDVNEMARKLQDILLPLIDAHIPIRKEWNARRCPHSPPPSLQRRRKASWRAYRTARNTHGRRSLEASIALESYAAANREYRCHFVNSQIRHELSLMESLKETPKKFHAYLRSKRVGPPSVGPLKPPGSSQITSDNHAMAEILVESFASVFSNRILDPINLQAVPMIVEPLVISEDDFANCLGRLNPNSSMGQDDLHPRLLKNCPALVRPIYKIFSENLRSGTVPDA